MKAVVGPSSRGFDNAESCYLFDCWSVIRIRGHCTPTVAAIFLLAAGLKERIRAPFIFGHILPFLNALRTRLAAVCQLKQLLLLELAR